MPRSRVQGSESRANRSLQSLLRFPTGTNVIDIGRPAQHVYLLRSGQVQLAGDKTVIFDYLTRGNFFGEKCLLRPACSAQLARSLEPVEVAAFRRPELLKRVQQDPAFALRLLKSLARRLDCYEQALRDFVVEPAERRLARLLARLTPTRAAAEWVRLRCSPSNAELARTIGTTRWRVAYFMGRFQRSGWLRRKPDLWIRRAGLEEFLRPPAA